MGGKKENDRPPRVSRGDGSEPGTVVHDNASRDPVNNRIVTRKLDSTEMARHFCNRLERLRGDTPRQWGKMTAAQMMCHLGDCFRGVKGELHIRSAVNPFSRTVMRWVALHTAMPWPHGVPTRPEMAQEKGGTPPAEWASDFAELKRRILEFPVQTDFAQHPVFGPMTLDEWHIWGYRHTDHHFRQFGL
jgi:hypothetical protein